MVVDVYTANVLYELRKLGNNLPYPSSDYPNIKVFFPYRLTQKIFNEIGEEYAKQFSAYHISRRQLKEIQDRVVMLCRPSMHKDLEKSNLKNGVFMYSLWTGYRSSDYQQRFEKYLENSGFSLEVLHTSGHATISDIQRVIQGLNSQKIIPIHTLHPTHFLSLSDRTDVKTDGVKFRV
jgi:ribonuclease J